MTRWITPLALAAALAGCDDTVAGQKPVLSSQPDPVEMERYARRLHLDLAGRVAKDSYVASAVDALTEAGNTAAAREELADELLASDEFSELFVGELENQVFGGESADDRYNLLCGIIRNQVACNACPAISGDSACAGCSCANLPALEAERLDLASAAADLAGGDATTSAIERRYASSTPLRGLTTPDATAQALFEAFLGRAPEGEELRNARMIIFGFVLSPGAPSGLLFQRHGSVFEDLIDILFESDVYREAVVDRVFRRYLGRGATAVELAHFSAQLDADDPDVRSVIRAVTSSREYFEQ